MLSKQIYRSRQSFQKYGIILRFLDGVEGGFAIFAGIVTGLSFSTVSRHTLIASALIGITVNAVNAAVIRYSSEHYYDELDGHEKHSAFRAYFIPAFIEFIVYMIMSCIALLPLLFIPHLYIALAIMITVCLTVLFVAGVIRGTYTHGKGLHDGIEVATAGMIMIAIGTGAGWLLVHLFGA